MPFGFNMAPAHFQYVMHTLLDAPPLAHRPNHAIYVDNLHVGGTGLVDTWAGTLEAIRRLTHGGFLLNAWKLLLLVY